MCSSPGYHLWSEVGSLSGPGAAKVLPTLDTKCAERRLVNEAPLLYCSNLFPCEEPKQIGFTVCSKSRKKKARREEEEKEEEEEGEEKISTRVAIFSFKRERERERSSYLLLLLDWDTHSSSS